MNMFGVCQLCGNDRRVWRGFTGDLMCEPCGDDEDAAVERAQQRQIDRSNED